MKVKKVAVTEAKGHILLRNQVGPDGRKAIKKGQRLTAADVATLQTLGQHEVYVAILEEHDIDENEAARRLGHIIAGAHIATSKATTGRVNLWAETEGVFKVNVRALLEFNQCLGLTLGTIANNSLVAPKKMLGTVKIIPYSIPQNTLTAAEEIARQQPLIELHPFRIKQAVLITTGSPLVRQKVIEGFTAPLRDRLATYQTAMISGPYVAETEQAIAEAIQEALAQKVGLILIAGETSVMDLDDITPRAIRAIGGEIVHHGVPVEPGNLLLLAYHGHTPIVGAPGCARSRKQNVVDMVLPRLATGERLTRQDLLELGHGGFIK